MAIEKMTLTQVNSRSYLAQKSQPKVYGQYDLTELETEMRNFALAMVKIHALVSFLNQYPDHDIAQAIGAITGLTPEINNKTKSSRSYFIPYLFIHENDKL